MTTEKEVKRRVAFVWLIIASIFVLGSFIAYDDIEDFQAINATLGFVGITSFFGVLYLPGGWSESQGFSESRIRFAVTASLLLLFIAYYSMAVFWFDVKEGGEAKSPLTDGLLETLADLLKIVIPFYFSAEVAREVLLARADAPPTSD